MKKYKKKHNEPKYQANTRKYQTYANNIEQCNYVFYIFGSFIPVCVSVGANGVWACEGVYVYYVGA